MKRLALFLALILISLIFLVTSVTLASIPRAEASGASNCIILSKSHAPYNITGTEWNLYISFTSFASDGVLEGVCDKAFPTGHLINIQHSLAPATVFGDYYEKTHICRYNFSAVNCIGGNLVDGFSIQIFQGDAVIRTYYVSVTVWVNP